MIKETLDLGVNWITAGKELAELVEKNTIESLLPRMQQMLHVEEFEYVNASGEMLIDSKLSLDAQTGLPVVKSNNNKTVAIIPVIGGLSKRGDLCAYGMQDYQAMLNKAYKADHIDAITILGETPGGTADGCPEFAMTLANRNKPVTVFVDRLLASAGYWALSQSDHIVANKNNFNKIGSIGTYSLYINESKKLEKDGIDVQIIRAPQSKLKNSVNSLEPLTEEGKASIEQEAGMINDVFIGSVTKARGEKLNAEMLDEIFAAQVYDSNGAKKAGLIDSISTFQSAVNKAGELAVQYKRNRMNPDTNKSEIEEEMNWKNKVLSLIGINEEQANSLSDEQAMKASEEKIAELQASLTGAVEAKAALEARISALETEAATHAEAVTAKEAEITTLKEQIAKAPAAQVTTVISNEEQEAKVGADAEGATTEKKNKYRTPTDDEADAYVNAVNTKLPLK